jgi:hypothetical protein
MLGVSQEHIENNGEDGCKDQDLKHEVIQGGPEKSDPALGRQRSSIIVSKLVRPLGKVFTVQTKFDIHAQFFGEALNASMFLGGENVLFKLPYLICVDQISQFLLACSEVLSDMLESNLLIPNFYTDS